MGTGVLLLAVLTAVIAVLLTAINFHQPAKQSLPKTLTFRVDDIPADQSDAFDHDLTNIIQRNPFLRAAAATLTRHSLVPKYKHVLCATVSIKTSLSAEDLCTRLRQAGTGHLYTYSHAFDGITPLHACPDGARVDIIAVPGLGSHPLGSWKSPTSNDVWLRDFLPKDLPNTRLLLYGYDTTLPGSLSKQSIGDLGGAFLEQLIAYRARDGTSNRPLILIGHSLGGLLIKQALVRARRKSNDANLKLASAAYGLLFFGVPHLGLRNDQLQTLVQGQPNEALIRDLIVDNNSEPSNFLKTLADQFSESCKGHYRAVCFFECMLSRTLEVSSSLKISITANRLQLKGGKWSKTGTPSLLVTEKSTTSTGLVAAVDEDNVALNTDHSGLIKYKSRSEGPYTIVRERLRRLVEEANQKLTDQLAEHSLYPPKSYTAQDCLISLAFQDMDGRSQEIHDAADGTCKWLLEHETLIQWTRQHRGLLWIKGHPGSGKSTLFKYALREVPARYSADTLAVSFYFHGRGHELQRTPLGLFRSILHNLLNRVPDAFPDLIRFFSEKQKTEGKHGEQWKWHLQTLQAFLESSLLRILERFPVILFIDALDECGESSAVQLINYFKRLHASIPLTHSRFGIFFSCRHYPILELHNGLTIDLEKANEADISLYVRSSFNKVPSHVHIEELISSRARGVFMWAQLVVERVQRLIRRGESHAKIESMIKQIPPTLEDLYREIIKGAEDRTRTSRLVEWICFSLRPLTTDGLQWAMAVSPDGTRKSLDECQASEDFIDSSHIETRIKVLSCGLAETVPSGSSRVVQFIHQSVQDFFVEHGLLVLDSANQADEVVPAAHCQLSRSCIHYFRLAVQYHRQPFRRAEHLTRFPFVVYEITSWVPHIQHGELAETSLSGFLDLLEWRNESVINSWVESYEQIVGYDSNYPNNGTKLLHIISRCGLARLAACILGYDGIDGLADEQDDYGTTPLSLAACYGHDVVVHMLLDTGMVEVDAKNNSGWTPLMWAAQKGHAAVVRLLLNNGATIDSADQFSRTPLWGAAERGYEAVVRLLLDNGATVDSADMLGRTPLWRAAERGYEAVVRLLLDNGATVDSADDIYDYTPLGLAATNGHEAVIRLLEDNGALR